MFYSVDLLTIRRNGKFAKCWLAANLRRKVFCMKFRRQTIFAINIAETCEELITYATDNSSQCRLSLYLSSQLLLGVVRIFYYQVDMFEEQQWALWFRTNAFKTSEGDEFGIKKRKRIPLPVPVDPTQLPPIEPPPASHTLRNVVQNIAQITLPEDNIFISGYEGVMRNADDSYFGALSPTQLARLLEHDKSFFHSPESVRVAAGHTIDDDDTLNTSKEPHVILQPRAAGEEGESRDVTLPRDDVGQTPLTEQIPLSEQDPRPDIFPKTPTKHKISPMPDIETPRTKKRRLDEMILIPLEDLIGSELSLPRRKKKQHELAIDTEKKLSNNVYSSQQDVAFQTIPKKPILIPRPSTKQLFETPSTRPAWGKPLAILYQMMTLKPIDEPSEDPVRPIVRRPDISTSGTLRELSDDILQPTETDSGDVNINVTGTLEPISHDDGTKLPPLVEDILEQPFWPGRPGLDNGRPHSLKSSSAQTNHEESITSTTRPGKTWVKADILGILEVLWSQQRLVTFKDLCLPSVCSRMDVAQAFVLLVDLHKSKDVKLLQAKPYEPIYIQKYKDFF